MLSLFITGHAKDVDIYNPVTNTYAQHLLK